MALTLIGGGSRSGKSSYALSRARDLGNRLGFLATAQAFDEEMRQRIESHRLDRGRQFTTIEEPIDLCAAINRYERAFDVIVIDCLTLWVSNLLMMDRQEIEQDCVQLVERAAQASCHLILVTNEVGCGIVPENALARRFRDLAGRLNQLAAAQADDVFWMVFGIPLHVKERRTT